MNSEDKKLMHSIAQDVLLVRQDVLALRNSFERAGLLVPAKQLNPDEAATQNWKAPILRKLGDMVTIIAKSNPVTAAELEKIGFDTEKDVATDPEVDPNADRDMVSDLDASTDTDPNTNERDLLPEIFGGDSDPNTNTADKKRDKKADPIPPNVRDDADDVKPKPDTELDRIES